jgi:hypothetical protein
VNATAEKKNPYSIKNLKTWETHDGGGFQATLYRDGKRIGLVTNDGWGGCNHYDLPREEIDALEAYAKTLGTLPADPRYPDLPALEYDGDLVVDELVSAFEIRKAWRRDAKKNLLFSIDGEDPREGWRRLKYESAAVLARPGVREKGLGYLRDKYGDRGLVVYDPATEEFVACPKEG